MTDTIWNSLTFIGVGFFLMAGGVPISSLAMFSFLATRVQADGWSWAYAALLVSLFTVAGHVAGYMVFRTVGPLILDRLGEKRLSLSRLSARFKGLKEGHRGFDAALLLLRWLGAGYSQVFWFLGVLGDERSATLRLLFLGDVLWAVTWSWALSRLVEDVPSIAKYMSRLGWLVLLLGLFAFGLGRLRRRNR